MRVDQQAVRRHLSDFVASRRGVEAYVEPPTNVTATTVILIAHDGEWTRRAAGSRELAFDLARSLDVGEVVDPTQVDVAAWIKDTTEGVGADAVIECSGNERALQTAIDAVRKAGRIAQTGLHTRAASIEPMKLSEHDITLAGTWCYPVTDWPRIIDLIARGRLPVEKVVTAQVPMADVVEKGFEVLLSPTGNQVKVLIDAQQRSAS